MSDSFFTSRNSLDRQMDTFPSEIAEQFVEAAVRRMVHVEGALKTAERLQRLADICAGAYVMPIEHWQKPEKPRAASTVALTTGLRSRVRHPQPCIVLSRDRSGNLALDADRHRHGHDHLVRERTS